MAKQYDYSDDDMFKDTRMSFGEHIEDLRSHLVRALKWFLAAMVASFFVGSYVVDFIKAPVEDALVAYFIDYYKDHPDQANKIVQRLKEELDQPPDKIHPAIQKLDTPTEMKVKVPDADLDQAFRRLYPQLFQAGGPLANAALPKAEAVSALNLKVRPMDFIEQFQTPMGLIAKRSVLTTLSVQEAFMVYFKVSILCGFVLASPFIFWEIWSFIAAGLYPHEKRLVHYYFPFAIFLFLAGVVLCEFWVIPAAIRGLLFFNEWMGLEPDFRLNEWLGFAIMMPIVFGISFQLPIVMLMLTKIGFFTPQQFRSNWRMAYFVTLVFAAVISPSIDAASLFLLWGPMIVLYELGILLSWRAYKQMHVDEDIEVPYSPEHSQAEAYSTQTPEGYGSREETENR